jgi:hypothetical protein
MSNFFKILKNFIFCRQRRGKNKVVLCRQKILFMQRFDIELTFYLTKNISKKKTWFSSYIEDEDEEDRKNDGWMGEEDNEEEWKSNNILG